MSDNFPLTANSEPSPLPDVPHVERRLGTPWGEKAPFILMMIVTLGLFSLLTLMNFHPVPDASKDLMNIMLGSIGTGWVAGINYFFGSSASNAKKDAALATVAVKAPPIPPTGTPAAVPASS